MPPIANLRLENESRFRPSQAEIDVFGDIPKPQPQPFLSPQPQLQFPPPPPPTSTASSGSDESLVSLGIKVLSVTGMIIILDDGIFDEVCRMVLPTRCRYDRLSRLYIKSLIISSGVLTCCLL